MVFAEMPIVYNAIANTNVNALKIKKSLLLLLDPEDQELI